MKKALLLLIFTLIISPVEAAEMEGPLKMEEVVVTATKSERAIEEVAGRIQVITKDELQKAPGQKIDDFLNNISGVNVIRSNGI